MALIIEQEPLYNNLPVGQQLIFTVRDTTVVGTEYKVKYIAIVESGQVLNATGPGAFVTLGTFKTTPNNAGSGIFDFRPVIENEVNPDNEPERSSLTLSRPSYKSKEFQPLGTDPFIFPLHITDKASLSSNNVRFFRIQFFTESSTTATGAVTRSLNSTTSALFTVINGVIQHDDVLTLSSGNYGYDMSSFTPNATGVVGVTSALSNAPTKQYARLTDYGTLPFLNAWKSTSSVNQIDEVLMELKNSSGVILAIDSYFIEGQTALTNGGYDGALSIGTSPTRLIYIGCFPANLQNWSTNFATHKADIASIEIYTKNNGVQSSSRYTIEIICDNERGYEGIRLCWLNQWGTWDYYTFNKKSVKSTDTNRETYTQLGGTWNEATFRISGHRGGVKNFRVNATEKISMNTGFLTDAEGVWMEELINSNEVYIVNSYDSTESSPYSAITNKYIEPVRVTTSDFIRKTVANDKLIQYTIEVEKSKTKRTQSV